MGSQKKSVFVLYAHPEETSFNSAILKVVLQTLRSQDCEVVVSDLYAMKFNPILGRHDIKDPPVNGDSYHHGREVAHAYESGRLADDIADEQGKLKAADLLLIISPIHNMGMPAIIQGWFSRVLVVNFAFDDDRMFDNAYMKGKKALLCLTTGAPHSFYTPRGPHGDINVILWPVQNGVLRHVGFDILQPQILYGVGLVSDDDRRQMLDSVRCRMQNVFNETPLYFVPFDQFTPEDPRDLLKGLTLTDAAIEREKRQGGWSEGEGLTPGNHIGLKVPSHHSMSSADVKKEDGRPPKVTTDN